MGYNRDLDEVVWSKDIDISSPFNRGTKFKFIVSVMRYDGGEKKIDIKRLTYGSCLKGEYGKVGRITKDEMESLMPVFQEAIGKI